MDFDDDVEGGVAIYPWRRDKSFDRPLRSLCFKQCQSCARASSSNTRKGSELSSDESAEEKTIRNFVVYRNTAYTMIYTVNILPLYHQARARMHCWLKLEALDIFGNVVFFFPV